MKSINETILKLFDGAREEKGDVGIGESRGRYLSGPELITQLKKVEIKFNELVEKRKMFMLFDRVTLLAKEK